MVHHHRVGALIEQQPHDAWLGETGGKPERRRADQLRSEMEVLRGSPRWRPGPERRIRIRAVIEQHANGPLVAAHDGLVQRRKTGGRRVRIGALIEEQLHQLTKA